MKKLRLAILCCSFSLILTSCSNSSNDAVTSPSDGTNASETPAPAPTPAPTPTTPAPEPKPSPSPVEPSPEPTPTPAPSPSPSPEPSPTPSPAPTPEPMPSPTPTEPSPEPTPAPTPTPPVATCPDSYEIIAENKTLGTASFCIAKFEMKRSFDGKASSSADGPPWIANKVTATESCAALGSGYRLPTNTEWNAAALEIYNQDANWTGDKKLSGTLYTGYYSGFSEPVGINDSNDPYDGPGNGRKIERRTFTLANGQIIWDFGGNAWEWVNDTIYGSAYTPDLSGNYARNYHNNNWDMKPGSAQLYDFTGMGEVPQKNVYLGNLFGGNTGRVIRGGAIGIHTPGTTGIFAANIGDMTANELQAPASWNLKMNNVGFRCIKELQ